MSRYIRGKRSTMDLNHYRYILASLSLTFSSGGNKEAKKNYFRETLSYLINKKLVESNVLANWKMICELHVH